MRGRMTDPVPPEGAKPWTWRRTIRVASMGAGGILLARGVLYLVAASFAGPTVFSDDQAFALSQGDLRTASYEILGDAGTITFSTQGATGPFSLYVVPEVQTEPFLSATAFHHLKDQAYVSVESASGSVLLPQGTYAIALACEAETSCSVPLHIEIAPARTASAIELVEAIWMIGGPVALWDQTAFVLQPGGILDEAEFFVRVPGALSIEATSNEPLRICLLTGAEFAAWLDGENAPAERCGPAATTIGRDLEIEPGDHALLVECVANDPCRGRIDVVFVAGRSDAVTQPPA